MLNNDRELINTCIPTRDRGDAASYLKTFRQGVGDYHAQAAFLWMAEALTIFNNEASTSSNLSVSITSPADGAEMLRSGDRIEKISHTIDITVRGLKSMEIDAVNNNIAQVDFKMFPNPTDQ